MGRWYENRAIPSWFETQYSNCDAANYGLITDGNNDTFISVRNSQLRADLSYDEACGYASVPDPVNFPGELTVVFPPGAADKQNPGSNYWILDTDYDAYSSVYFCVNDTTTGGVRENAWLLTRDTNPDQSVIDTALQKFIDIGVDVSNLQVRLQGQEVGCVYDNPQGNCQYEFP